MGPTLVDQVADLVAKVEQLEEEKQTLTKKLDKANRRRIQVRLVDNFGFERLILVDHIDSRIILNFPNPNVSWRLHPGPMGLYGYGAEPSFVEREFYHDPSAYPVDGIPVYRLYERR